MSRIFEAFNLGPSTFLGPLAAVLILGACSKKEHAQDPEHHVEAVTVDSGLEIHGNLVVHGKISYLDPASGEHGEHGSHGSEGEHHGDGGHHGDGKAASHCEAPAVPDVEWGYDGDIGPESWGKLDPAFEACATGQLQSPIDIDEATPFAISPLDFRYTPISLKMLNTGKTIKVDGARGGSIEFAAKRYNLSSLEFRSPSEHRVRGRSYDLVAHLIHESPDGEKLVISVPFVIGEKNRGIDLMWKHFPTRNEEKSEHPDIFFNAGGLLPSQRAYYTYIGSETTPPCREGVRWIFLKTPSAVSSAQVARFKRSFPKSTRPLQQLQTRTIAQGR